MHRIPSIALLFAGCLSAMHVCAAETIRIEDAVLTLIEQVELPAKEPGSLAELSVREGGVIEPGQQLAAIEDDEARVAAVKADRELEVARAKAENDVAVRLRAKRHEVAAAEYRRAEESVEKFQKSVSQTELDQLRLSAERVLLGIEQAEVEQAVARLVMRQKEAELQSARLKLDRHRLLSPLVGMVAEIKMHAANGSIPVIPCCGSFGSTGYEWRRSCRRDFAAHLQGQTVALVVDLPNQNRTGSSATIVFVSPEINAVNGQVLIWAEVDNQSLALRPGQIATLEFESPESVDQPIQPLDAK